MSEVLIRIKIDDAELDRYARRLYDEAEDEAVPPDPGGELRDGWFEEMRYRLNEGGGIDTLWWEPENAYVESVTVECQPGKALEEE